MTKLRKLLTPALMAAAMLGTSVMATGCFASGRYGGAVVVHSEPPPPRAVYVDTRPGYVWVDGRWNWDDYSNEWVWYDGYYEQERAGYYYVAGSWQRNNDRYVYSHPRWVSRSDAHVTVRVNDRSRATKVRVRDNSGHKVPARRGRR